MDIDPSRELVGREGWGIRAYLYGFHYLFLANATFLFIGMPPAAVWLWLNGFGFALVLLGKWLIKGSASADPTS